MSVFNILYSTNIKERLNKIDFKFMKLPLTPNDCRIQKIKKRGKRKCTLMGTNSSSSYLQWQLL